MIAGYSMVGRLKTIKSLDSACASENPFWTPSKEVHPESEDLRCHAGPVSYMWCSSGGQPVSLDLQLIGTKEATSHLVPRAGPGGDP